MFSLSKLFSVKDWKGGGAEPKFLKKSWVCNPGKPDQIVNEEGLGPS